MHRPRIILKYHGATGYTWKIEADGRTLCQPDTEFYGSERAAMKSARTWIDALHIGFCVMAHPVPE